ncbi:NAD-dependent epimerase/dehydratase family protein [Bradyrhizobium septentrionale]|uniref:NAD(P)-dependent oxidoreductase n=1 Tax=Bradyrhizobium septentrionale TaxID=1404411 RepID=A0A974A3N2_9BRAD|nr:NAD(P)-dependent oxidoreductase [Bradyrhizobium septentrionale]UGY16070.1 NAD(P)-dependent oxidoreductase [Bradyrhizobium septentrionale]UGY24643.1 NAD(P)-dependent oxidoreductase [Bradyrhizobium septentrionale]
MPSPNIDLTGSHVLLTGAAGFLGSRLLRLLQSRGVAVTALIRPGAPLAGDTNARTVEADLSGDFSPDLQQVGRVDAIIHLAQAGGWKDFPRQTGAIAAVSIAAAARLAEYGVSHGARQFILASSGGIYGPSAQALTEDAPIRPTSELGFYLQAKASAETLLQCFEPHLVVSRLRYFFIYGPGQSEDFLIARISRSIARGESIRLGEACGPRLNPIYVDDAARATMAALDLKESCAINVAGPEIASLREIAELIANVSNHRVAIEPVDKSPDHYVGATDRMVKLLGSPTIGLKDGISRVCHLEKAE